MSTRATTAAQYKLELAPYELNPDELVAAGLEQSVDDIDLDLSLSKADP